MAKENIGLSSSRTKYSQLDETSGSAFNQRPSLEAAYRDSSGSSDEEDVEEFDPLNYDAGTLKRKKDPSVRRRRKLADADAQLGLPRSRRTGWRRFRPSKFHCVLIGLFFACVFLLLGAGGLWAYNYKPPPTGPGQAWNPAPRGGTDEGWAKSYAKAAKLVRQMTLPEKVNVTTGIGWQMGLCVGNTGPVPRLKFPSLCLQDGPLGIRFADNITAFPAGVTTGATWNKNLAYERGKAHGQEARLKGVNVLLGPTVGPLGRTPMGGRNWEGFGADPVLQGMLAAEDIKGIQEQGVMATVKHYLGNEQEHFRQAREWHTLAAISSEIGERTLRELYAWPFLEAVRVGVASVMCAYNRVNGTYACSNDHLLNRVLKDEMGFQGFVQSDWLAQRDGVPSALSGLDMTMPGDGLKWAEGESLWGSDLTRAVLNGAVPVERLDDMVTRIVASWYQLGQDDEKKWPREGPNFSSWTNEETGYIHAGSDDKTKAVVNKFINAAGEGEKAHKHLARKVAAEGTVLVKNQDDVLPLNKAGGKPKAKGKFKVGIYGQDSRLDPEGPNSCEDRNCNRATLAQGWGSGSVEYPYLVAPDEALEKAYDLEKVEIAKSPTQEVPKQHKAKQQLHDRDLCIVFANADSGEGYMAPVDGTAGDRNNLKLDNKGNELIQQVAGECGGDGSSPTVVVLHTVGPVLVDKWIDMAGVKAVLFAMLPGQESGNAIVDILFGDVNPSGRLPWTIGKTEKDYGPSRKIKVHSISQYPSQTFDEGLYIDYRYFDKYDIEPRYEFGYGLSYTTFHLSSLMIQPKAAFIRRQHELEPPENTTHSAPSYNTSVPSPSEAVFPSNFRKLQKYIYPYIGSEADVPSSNTTRVVPFNKTAPASSYGYQGGHPGLYEEYAEITASLTNTGERDGSAVVQLYVSFPQDYRDPDTGAKVDFPVRVLRNFQKITVKGGNRRAEVRMSLTRRDLSYWCERRKNWVIPEKGAFKVMLGFSSRDFPAKMTGTLD